MSKISILLYSSFVLDFQCFSSNYKVHVFSDLYPHKVFLLMSRDKCFIDTEFRQLSIYYEFYLKIKYKKTIH